MTAESLELVRRAFDAINARDLDALLALLDPEVEVRSLMTEAEQTTYTGHAGVRQWFAAVLEVFPDWRPELHEVREADGGGVVSSFHVTATGAASGVEIDQGYWQAGLIRDGVIQWFGFFRTEEDALAALGSS